MLNEGMEKKTIQQFGGPTSEVFAAICSQADASREKNTDRFIHIARIASTLTAMGHPCLPGVEENDPGHAAASLRKPLR